MWKQREIQAEDIGREASGRQRTRNCRDPCVWQEKGHMEFKTATSGEECIQRVGLKEELCRKEVRYVRQTSLSDVGFPLSAMNIFYCH